VANVKKIQQPNILFVFSDQQRWDTTGVHGNPLDLTPNFDRMAQEGTHLFNTFTCQPVCGPARACLQTGMYATRLGCFRNGIPLPAGSVTLADCFRRAGYRTGYIGKWHLADGDIIGAVPLQQRGGYEDWLAANVLEFTSEAYHTVLYDNDDCPVTLPGYRVDALTDAAVCYFDSHQQRPFFLFLSYLEPHFQNRTGDYPAPDGYAERYAGRWIPPDLAALTGTAYQHLPGYYGMVKRLDEALGRLLDALKSLNLLDNTIVIYTSDHGNHFKTRNAECKRSCHEASVRIPAAVQGPGFWGGGRVQELVSLLDLPPTLLDAAGIPVPMQMDGHSLMPLLRRQPIDWNNEIFIQISEAQVGRALRTPRWKYGVAAHDKDGSIDSGSDRYSEECLYDLYADPYELNNLVGRASHQELASLLRERLMRRMVAAGETTPIIEAAPSRPSGQSYLTEEELAQ
jgi:arylsulfatase A-like enzyme